LDDTYKSYLEKIFDNERIDVTGEKNKNEKVKIILMNILFLK